MFEGWERMTTSEKALISVHLWSSSQSRIYETSSVIVLV